MKTIAWILETIKWLGTIPIVRQLILVLLALLIVMGWIIIGQEKKIDILREKIEVAAQKCEQEKELIKAVNTQMMVAIVANIIIHEKIRQVELDSVINEGKELLRHSNEKMKKLKLK